MNSNEENALAAVLQARLTIHPERTGGPVPARVFGNFLEHLGYSADGGVLAQALANPGFERDARLDDRQVRNLLETGRLLVKFYRAGLDPNVFPEHWSPGIGATGFGVSALDDHRTAGVPFPWAPLGQEGAVSASVGRIGGAVRLRGTRGGQPLTSGNTLALDDLASGIRQGIFLPVQRCLGYHGHLWARIAAVDSPASGRIEVGLRRRLGGKRAAGDILALDELHLEGTAWNKLAFKFQLSEGQVSTGEPLDFFVRWLPEDGQDLLHDTAVLLPDDAVEDTFDPDVLRVVREWKVPLLRWPGGNFVSYYHWRDGVGPLDRRPTRPNYAWGGLDTNYLGTREFIHFCRLVGAEPHLVVNTGTGSAEEAAAWVEFCNGSAETPMGRLRAAQGDAEPYNVKLWEVGNEIYGFWQGGYHGGEENALRFLDFAQAMRQVDPSIELIATGNQFDIAQPGPGYDHTAADRQWNRELIERASGEIDYLSLHCLPANDVFIDHLNNEDAYYSLMAQPDSWERVFIPDILRMADEHTAPGKAPLKLAITEWGVLGPRRDARPVVENYGEVPYAGVFLNMAIRNAERVGVNNATALLHGGCIRKAGGQVFYDPQYTVIQQYTGLAGGCPLRCVVESPVYSVETAPDLGLPLRDVPYLYAAAVDQDGEVTACLVNRHRNAPLRLSIARGESSPARWTYLSHPDVTARARLGDPERFKLKEGEVTVKGSTLSLDLPPCSVSWVRWGKKE